MFGELPDFAFNPREWMLCFLGDNQAQMLKMFVNDLDRDLSKDGNGKVIRSGFSYWGIGPTLGWHTASVDPLYLNAEQASRSFPSRWESPHIKGKLGLDSTSYVYVSLGIGTGKKDKLILHDLVRATEKDSKVIVFAVDVSAEMLRFAISEIMDAPELRNRVLPIAIQADFTNPQNIVRLGDLVSRNSRGNPVLYSLLGNTIANFERDRERLGQIARLLKRDDRLLIEVGTTERFDDEAAVTAAREYRNEPFQKFVTSSILSYTDLPVLLDQVRVDHSLELSFGENGQDRHKKSILLKILYVSNKDQNFRVPSRDGKIRFPKNDTIRIYLTRKYTNGGMEQLLSDAGLYSLGSDYVRFTPLVELNPYFGMSLYLAARSEARDAALSEGTTMIA